MNAQGLLHLLGSVNALSPGRDPAPAAKLLASYGTEPMNPAIGYTAVLGAVVAATVAHGQITGRWAAATVKESYTLPELPMKLGDWVGEDQKSNLADDPNLKNLTRKFTHAKSGRAFMVSLTVGPAGLTAQHTPEYCYPGSGYKSAEATRLFAPGTAADSFRTTVFRKESTAGHESVRILWAWSTAGQWSAPAYPELQFLGGSALYKLYVVSTNTESPDNDAELRGFMSLLLNAIFPAAKPVKAAA